MIAIFEPDFIFCCPSFVPDIFDLRFLGYKKSDEIIFFVHRRNPKKVSDIDNFKKDSSMLILPALSICVNQCILTNVFAYTITEQLFIGSLLRMCLILKNVIHVKDTALKKI